MEWSVTYLLTAMENSQLANLIFLIEFPSPALVFTAPCSSGLADLLHTVCLLGPYGVLYSAVRNPLR